jgi:hypothetical protein
MRNSWIAVLVLTMALGMPLAAQTHAGHTGQMKKALGTVSSIDAPHVMLKTSDGKSLMIMLDKTTEVTRGKDKLDGTAIKAGDRMTVEYMEDAASKMMMAHTIKLATSTAPKK